jgi:hypothetical protein
MPQISDETFAFLAELLRDHLQGTLDDPSYMVHPGEQEPPEAQVAKLKRACLEVGIDWDGTLATAHPFDRERLLSYGRGETNLEPLIARLKGEYQEAKRAELCERIRDLLDDPSNLAHEFRAEEPQQVIGRYRAAAKALGLAWEDLMALGSEFERQRLADIESGKLQPRPRRAD